MADHQHLSDALPPNGIGIDAGSTLVKVAVVTDGAATFSHHPTADRESVLALAARHADLRLAVTGAGAVPLADVLDGHAPALVSEFDAIAKEQ